MPQAKPIGTFKLGSALWTILQDEEMCDLTRYTISNMMCTITLPSSYRGKVFNLQFIEKNMWEAIINVIVKDTMYYSDSFPRTLFVIYSSLFYQALETLVLEDWEGSVQIGGIEYAITIDNDRCDKEGFSGCCYAYEKIIVLTNQDNKRDPLPDDYIWQTLYHEILHAIARETGHEDTEINSERFVNILSLFLYEVKQSLTYNFQI